MRQSPSRERIIRRVSYPRYLIAHASFENATALFEMSRSPCKRPPNFPNPFLRPATYFPSAGCYSTNFSTRRITWSCIWKVVIFDVLTIFSTTKNAWSTDVCRLYIYFNISVHPLLHFIIWYFLNENLIEYEILFKARCRKVDQKATTLIMPQSLWSLIFRIQCVPSSANK